MSMLVVKDFDQAINHHFYQAKVMIDVLKQSPESSSLSKVQQEGLQSACYLALHMVYLGLLQRYAAEALPSLTGFKSAKELQQQLQAQGIEANELNELIAAEQSAIEQHWLANLVKEYSQVTDPRAFLQAHKQRQADKRHQEQHIAVVRDEAQPTQSQEAWQLCQACYDGLQDLVQRYRDNAAYY